LSGKFLSAASLALQRLQYMFTQADGVALAPLCELYNFFGDSVRLLMIAITHT